MAAVTDLATLLATLSPRLTAGEWVFATLPHGAAIPSGLTPIGTFREDEGFTVICRAEAAREHGLPFDATFRQITLDANSALTAVGLTAAVAAALTREHIPCNVVAAFHHDHVFVPTPCAEQALKVLIALSGAHPLA